MKKTHILFLVFAVLFLSSSVHFGISQAQSVVTAEAAHITCKPALDYPHSNGYVESYTRSNQCHSKRVFYKYANYFAMGNCGAGPWCAWRVRCPAGSTIQTHNSGGGWHYGMSPNIDGMYDGPAHHFCVDASGNQVDPIPGESEANPYHAHSVNVTKVSLAKVQVVDTNQTFYYTFYPNKLGISNNWVDCPAGATGASSDSSSSLSLESGVFPLHFHCRSASQDFNNSTDSDDNSEALPVALVTQPSNDLVGSGFSWSLDSTTPKDQFVEKTANWGQTPLGTVRCVSTTSEKVYFSTTGNCPSASEFPAKPSYSVEVTKLSSAGTIAANPGATASIKFSVKNTSTADANFPIYCDSGYGGFLGNLYTLNIDGTTGSKFYNPGPYSDPTSLPSGNIDMAPGSTKSFEFKFNIPASGALGTWTAKCHTYPLHPQNRNQMGVRGEIQDAVTVTPGTSLPPPPAGLPPPPPSTGTANSTVTLTQLFPGQYSNTKFSVTVADSEGIKEFLIKKINALPLYGGSPSCAKSVTSSTVTIEASDFPLTASVTDCRAGAAAYSFSVPALGSLLPPPPPIIMPPPPITMPPPPLTGAPTISYLSPQTGKVGANVTITGTGFTATGNKIKFGNLGSENNPAMSLPSYDGKTLTFTVPSTNYLSCWSATPACMAAALLTQPGMYEVTVINANGMSNATMFQVTAHGSALCAAAYPSPNSVCVEPGSFVKKEAGKNYWCPGGSDVSTMMFYSATDAHCATKPVSDGSMIWTAGEVKTKLNALGSGWGLCGPVMGSGSTGQCKEPGEWTTSQMDWCAWTPPMYSYSWNSNGTRLCSALDENITAPPPPWQRPGPDDHMGCDMMMYTLNGSRQYIDERGNIGPATDAAHHYRNFGDHWHYCSSSTISPPPPYLPPPPSQMRECASGEIPSGSNMCMLPMYRWNIEKRVWEKCESINSSPYVSVMGNPKATHTNCIAMALELEGEWRADMYAIHDPRVDGEWYMPPWDASATMYRYEPSKDDFVECGSSARSTMSQTVMPYPYEYSSSCNPVPEKDRGWLLKKYRAEYEMWKRSQKYQPPVTPPGPGDPILPPPPIIILPIIPEIPVPQCRLYMVGIRQSTAGNKAFWKDVKRQLDRAPADYPDRVQVQALLDEARKLIVEIDRMVKANKCEKKIVADLREKTNRLNTDIFPELSSYLADIRDFADFAQCQKRLTARHADIIQLLKKTKDEGQAKVLRSLSERVFGKLSELKEKIGNVDFDATFECESLERQVEEELAPLTLRSDEKIGQIIEDVINEKLSPVFDKLAAQLAERGKKVETLLVQVAELHKAVENVSTSASRISEQIATSYSALAHISDRFEKEKTAIENAKSRLIPLVERATSLVAKHRCIRGAERDNVINQFGEIASVNWIGERAEALEQRLNLFISSCEAKDVSRDDLAGFTKTVARAEEENLADSYKVGIAPFADVPTHEWYYAAMVQAKERGYLTVGRPGENVLRQDALLMIERAARFQGIEGDCRIRSPKVTDISPYAACAVNLALDRGLSLSGPLNTPIRRVEVALWMKELLDLPKASDDVLASYTDLKGLSSSERDALAAVVANGLMTGNITAEGAVFQPSDPLTRSALAVIMSKIDLPQ